MKTTATNRKIRVLLRQLSDGTLIPRPEFQRRLVWSNRHKLAFIDTVLQGLPFPEVYLAAGDVDPNTGDGVELLVDGQQRLTTLRQYFTSSDELRLRDKITPYAELTDEKKIAFLEYEVVVRDLGKISIREIKEVFQRINSTRYALNAMETRNARFDGALKKFAESFARHQFFQEHNVFSANDIRRMHDIRFALVLVTTVLSTYFHRDDEVEAFLEQYNDEFPLAMQLGHDLSRTLSFVNDCRFGTDSRAWKKADLFTLLVEVYKSLFKDTINLAPLSVGTALGEFYKRVSDRSDEQADVDKDAKSYRYYSVQATNDRSSRIERGRIIRKLLLECSTADNLFSTREEESDSWLWDEAAYDAVEAALSDAQWISDPPGVVLTTDDLGRAQTASSIDELRSLLHDVAAEQALPSMPHEGGNPVFEIDLDGIVNNVLDSFSDNIESIGWQL